MENLVNKSDIQGRRMDKIMKTLLFVTMFCFCLLFIIDKSQAAYFNESLIAASLSLPMGADVAAMGNIGTLEEFSSANPAVTSIMKDGNASATMNYGYFDFSKTHLQTISTSVTGKIEKVVMQVGIGHAQSPMREVDEFSSFRIKRNDVIDFQIGGNVANSMFLDGDELYLGAGYAFTKGVQDGIFFTPTPATTFVNVMTMDSTSHGATLGFAYKPIKEITLGGFGSRTWSETQATYDGWQDSENAKSFYDVGHLGFSAKLFENTTLAADYQHVSFSNSSTKFDQYYVGVEQYLIPETLAIYLGDANGGITTGIGLYFKNGGVNLSYGKGLSRETKDTLGKADAFMVSGYFSF